MQSSIALTLFKAEQTSGTAQNKGNHKSVSNLYWQFIHGKTHFWLKMYYLFNKTTKISKKK